MFDDDASRFILAYGKFKRATKDSIKVFKRSLQYGIYKQLYSDNDSGLKQMNKKENGRRIRF